MSADNKVHNSGYKFSRCVLILREVKVDSIYEMHDSSVSMITVFSLGTETHTRIHSFNYEGTEFIEIVSVRKLIPLKSEPVCPVDQSDWVQFEAKYLQHHLFHATDLLNSVGLWHSFHKGIYSWNHSFVLLGSY